MTDYILGETESSNKQKTAKKQQHWLDLMICTKYSKYQFYFQINFLINVYNKYQSLLKLYFKLKDYLQKGGQK